MKKNIIRNIGWIALLAVWSFLAGAYFHLGWVRGRSISYREGFILGGIAIWIVFTGMGIFIYRFAKKHGNTDPAKPALSIVSFFTVVFLLIAWIKYDEVKQDKFMDDLELDFILHYEDKAAAMDVEIKDLDFELQGLYFDIEYDLKRHPQLEKLMKFKTNRALFEENKVISNLCKETLKMNKKYGYPPPAGMEKLFN